VRSLIAVLDNDAFAGLPSGERGQWLEDSRLAVLEMNQRYPGNRMAEAATLRLAEVYTDGLGDADKAIELFDAVAQDPSASAENISLARIGLARAYVVAGDTLQAREAFIRIGTDTQNPSTQSRANYHLGLLDFMGGEFQQAEDRLKAVALKTPRASFTNDALDLAILIAEENFGGAPDEEGLRMYGVMLYHSTSRSGTSPGLSRRWRSTGSIVWWATRRCHVTYRVRSICVQTCWSRWVARTRRARRSSRSSSSTRTT
jgi:tetratricopeptide (TPR) repeat protein